MSLPIDQMLIECFEAVLGSPPPSGRQKEQAVQDFLEANTELLPMHCLENHGLHLNAIIAKLPLGTALVTDYAFLTKSSSRWVVTFVELESPDKAIFTGDMDRPTFSATFNAAIAQVDQWKHYVDEHRSEVRASLSKLMHPMPGNKLSFAYQLIIGRSADKNLNDDRKSAFEMRRDGTGIDVFTYDALISYYRTNVRDRRNILVASRQRFAFKSMDADIGDMLAWIGPDALKLTVAQHQQLLEQGYEIEPWSKGKLLKAAGGRRVFDLERETRELMETLMTSATQVKRGGGRA